MRYHRLVMWSLAASMALGTTPLWARPFGQPGNGNNDHAGNNGHVRIVAIDKQDDPDETRAFGDWFSLNTRGYDDTDRETGERIGDLLQMVTEVSSNRLMVTDQSNLKRAVFVSDHTQVSFPDTQGRSAQVFSARKGRDVGDLVKKGDLVIVQGWLRNNGGLYASSIRVYGQARGWYDDDQPSNTRSWDGIRAWGDVKLSDTRKGFIEVNTNLGFRRFCLDRDGHVMVNGREQDMTYIRPGDRVVVYYNAESMIMAKAYRIVVLRAGDRYPDGNRPHYCDPNYQGSYSDQDRADTGNLPTVTGRLDHIDSAFLFDQLVLTDRYGRETKVRITKRMKAIDRDGDEVLVRDLPDGARLSVSYVEVNGNKFAKEINVQ